MQTQILILAGFAFIILIVMYLIIRQQNQRIWNYLKTEEKNQQPWQVMSQWLQEMRNSLDRHTQQVQNHLYRTNQDISQRLDQSAQLMRLLNKDLGEIHEIGQQMRDFQYLFRSPKLRGNIGEHILKDLLAQVLPRSQYKLQYRYPNGVIVDAMIKTDNGLIPIDAKFPMENFLKMMKSPGEKDKQFQRDFVRDVKRHIENIHQRYIQPDEGTLDFAVMYVPSEAVFYEIMTHDHLSQYARQKNILMVSPNSFYYFLRVILMASEGKRIEEASKRIVKILSALNHDTKIISNDLRILTTHINNSKNAAERVLTDFQSLERKIEQAKYVGELKSENEGEKE